MSSQNVPNRFHQDLKSERCDGIFLEGSFKEMLVYRFLTRLVVIGRLERRIMDAMDELIILGGMAW